MQVCIRCVIPIYIINNDQHGHRGPAVIHLTVVCKTIGSNPHYGQLWIYCKIYSNIL